MVTKEKEITQIAAIAAPYYDGQHSYIILPKSWSELRVFCLLKSEWDKICRQEERKNTAQIGKFASALIQGGKKCKKC